MKPRTIDTSRKAAQGLCAADIMTKHPRSLCTNDTVAHAIELLRTVPFRHLPVVDEDSRLVGMLTDRDIGALVEPYATGRHDVVGTILVRARAPVAALMTRPVVQAAPDTPIERITQLLLDHRIGAVLIVDPTGRLLGIVSSQDVLRTLPRPAA